ncbi:MAG: 16S rRNA (guanine(966)-N(2))-methyltransferase RsmD [Microbacterium gubbeenense]|uniref:16S rRNA (guanine(966)-N(2))-methyltransferase RsmD n=2 Tax=Microbacterium gubbeenense TaxID=159896 RepID=UPI0003F8BB45|nr:16S rRNA (guanine(966)-N(2))-methyltransferase RsmD [Microbacterium gubbeenense]
MTRIISGTAGGTRLTVPTSGTRPTSDRVREALFSALESTGMLEDTAVVDLYAGSGALGLEAISRGAAVCDLVEKSQKAAQVARRNAEAVARATGVRAAVHAAAVQTFLRSAARTYDVAFVDPPYDLADDTLTADLALLGPRLAADALVIVERATRSGAPQWEAAGMRPVRDRTFGDTALWWGEPAV